MIKLIHKYRQFEHGLTRKWPIRVILIFVLFALIHPFIANERPIYCKINGQHYFPVVRNIAIKIGIANPYKEVIDFDWKHKLYDQKIMPLIPYAHNTIDKRNAHFKSPFEKQEIDNIWQRHWLGTDILGRDVAAGLLKGSEIAVRIGFFSVALACIFALLIGFFAAYFRTFPLKVRPIDIAVILVISLGGVYGLWVGYNGMLLEMLIIMGLLFLICGLFIILRRRYTLRIFNTGKIDLPLDGMYMRVVEAFKALPVLILLLACISIFETISITGLVLILALLMWAGLSRYIRAESLKILSQDYITAAQSYGASKLRIMYKHVLPKLFTSLSVILAFGISSAIIIEATLSFLGIGLPIEQVSWGSMLKEAKVNFSAWWLAIFPGLALFILILSLNVLGEELEKKQ